MTGPALSYALCLLCHCWAARSRALPIPSPDLLAAATATESNRAALAYLRPTLYLLGSNSDLLTRQAPRPGDLFRTCKA